VRQFAQRCFIEPVTAQCLQQAWQSGDVSQLVRHQRAVEIRAETDPINSQPFDQVDDVLCYSIQRRRSIAPAIATKKADVEIDASLRSDASSNP
jgi:23S rRNA G2445 N2-methylase RlmL